MIYVCIPSHDEAETIGLVLWRVRKAFEELGREYHVLVGNDGSTDRTPEVLDTYAEVLPLTIRSERTRKGYASTAESLLRQALELSDRPKRDGAILMHGDLAHGPQYIGDFVRRLDSGADLVVGEGSVDPAWERGYRWTRRWSAYLLGRSAGVAGVRDPSSGFIAFRLATLRAVFHRPQAVLLSDGWAANAELAGRAAVHARRVETVSFTERHDLKSRATRVQPWPMARSLWTASGVVRRAIALEQPPLRGSKRRERGTTPE
jgi:glycosyltransferase involved in cell wall biosynthesis